jgi:hypothetical protein
MLSRDDRAEASLAIDGTLVSGCPGVNSFSSQMDAEFPIGPIVTTRMGARRN